MPNEKRAKTNKGLPLTSRIGILLVFLAVLVAVLNYFPIVSQEIAYIARDTSISQSITPLDTDFGIVVPKINANARIMSDVNPTNSVEYQKKLAQGVAHAKGTPKPDEPGNVFLFAHSSDNFFNANQYNSIFYLLHRLETGDKFEIYYKHIRYEYEIIEKSIVDSTRVDYMKKQGDQDTVTLMTCWPPGTTLKRLVVVGKKI